MSLASHLVFLRGWCLLLCFINDLPNRITSKIKLYADDVLLYTTIHSQDDCHRLQQDFDTLEQWALDWKMSFNLQKCEFLRITNNKKPNNSSIHSAKPNYKGSNSCQIFRGDY